MTKAIAPRLLVWFDQHGRHNLPWQAPRSAYRVWLSEIMLQQTQVATVIPYFERFIDRFPDLASLARSDQDDVLALWAGLGYYSRARNLHKAAQIISRTYGGEFPRDIEQLVDLPGIGQSTAAAILAQAYGQRHAILDGNVKRVLSRYHAIEGWAGQATVLRQLWRRAEQHTPAERLSDYTQAIMDLGATLCKRRKPLCGQCPLASGCKAFLLGRVDELPTPRPRQSRPQRHTQMLVIHNSAGEILLEKRPPTGIWGGLWSLPELPEGEDTERYCRQRLALKVGSTQVVPPIKHGFTHFELTIQPLLVSAATGEDRISEPGQQQWYKPARAKAAPALPAPLSKLLHGRILGEMITDLRQKEINV